MKFNWNNSNLVVSSTQIFSLFLSFHYHLLSSDQHQWLTTSHYFGFHIQTVKRKNTDQNALTAQSFGDRSEMWLNDKSFNCDRFSISFKLINFWTYWKNKKQMKVLIFILLHAESFVCKCRLNNLKPTLEASENNCEIYLWSWWACTVNWNDLWKVH